MGIGATILTVFIVVVNIQAVGAWLTTPNEKNPIPRGYKCKDKYKKYLDEVESEL